MLLLKNRSPLQRRLVKALSESPGRILSVEGMAAQVAASPDDVHAAISHLNRWAEAFGFLPLISDTPQGASLDPETAAVVSYTLDELERMGS